MEQREIKFRGFSRKDKKMYFGELVKSTSGWLITNYDRIDMDANCGDGLLGDIIAWRIDEVSQFTGQKDKNGVDIYEDDILGKVKNSKNKVLQNPKVIFEDAAFLIVSNDFDFKYELLRYYESESELEVIGNIYENPELAPK
jgi:uncharacterized phage protein (TIGR01671 family)